MAQRHLSGGRRAERRDAQVVLGDKQISGTDLSWAEHWSLAVNPEPLTPARLVADLGPRVGSVAVIEAIQAVRRRSLVKRGGPGPALSLHQVVLDYFASLYQLDPVAA